ncbi:MAG: hypoxanthine phosphoribosyltransferase [Bacteroidales bacterium]|nr:hypoxanthine phosphoribosyltransferase [Bacteroidales bacterium]
MKFSKPRVGSIIIENKKFLRYLTSKQIEVEVKRIAGKINKDMDGMQVVFLVVLTGAFMFAADLLRRINFQAQVSLVRASSYKGMVTPGKVQIMMCTEEKLENKVVVVIEDIIDTGLTLKSILGKLEALNPGMVKTVALLFKPDSYKMDVEPDYVGFSIPGRFVGGYGLDYKGYGRNLAEIYLLEDA